MCYRSTMSADETTPASSRAAWLKLGVMVSVVFGLLVLPGRYPGRVVSILYDFAHAPLFALVTFLAGRVLYSRSPEPSRVVLLALGTTSLGGAGELVQHLAGRSARVDDAVCNAVGAGLGGLVLLWPQLSRGRRAAAAGVFIVAFAVAHFAVTRQLCDVVLQKNQFPLLGSFESSLEMLRWQVNVGHIERSANRAAHGQHALRWELFPGKYPSCAQRWPPHDWRDHRFLEFKVLTETDAPLDLVVKIQDFEHSGEFSDRFHQRIVATGEWQTIRVELDAVRRAPRDREMDMALITRLSLFTIDLQTPCVVWLDDFRLTKSPTTR